MQLNGKKIVVVVAGGIAAYKSADLVSRLRRAGAEVRVAMTASAREFVAPLTFEALSGHPVYESVLGRAASWEMEHIAWARWADAIVVAPATANLIAKAALGLADDAATTLLLAYDGPLWFAPAMNTNMLEHAATQHNLATLKERGARIIDPESGTLACGEIGAGRMAQPEVIIEALTTALARNGAEGVTDHNAESLAGRTVLITTGPTREALDPIRFISNRSTGQMGVALAREAIARGAHVILIAGPLGVPVPEGVQLIAVESAREMLAATQRHWDRVDIAIFAAAVANYESGARNDHKIKGGETLTLQLARTPDIAAWAGSHRREGQVLIGFCAESTDLLATARQKLEAKQLDLICANPIGESGVGFAAAENEVTMLAHDGSERALGRGTKREIARRIWTEIETRRASLPPRTAQQLTS